MRTVTTTQHYQYQPYQHPQTGVVCSPMGIECSPQGMES